MGFIYNLGIHLARFGLKNFAPFNDKIKLGVEGRTNTFKILENKLKPNDKTLWFHCASLGEYEQGLPVFKELRQCYKSHKIILSFFSPSGYEIRKNTPVADIVVYLPIDTKNNARKFVNLVKPELTVFVKYDIWPNFLNEIKNNGYRAILISAAFRGNQNYFKFYGKILRNALFCFEHIFTQNEMSKQLLKSIGYKNVTISGDTRFDRVLDQLKQNNHLEFIEKFKHNDLCVVAGSTWPEDEALLISFINSQSSKGLKFVIAPHNIKDEQIAKLQKSINVNCVLFSDIKNENIENAQVLIINTIGLLTKIYSYADVAFVGGAVGNTGLHNTLEAAVFGIPIIIGNNYSKFPEAKDMIAKKGMFSISNQSEFNTTLNMLITDKEARLKSGKCNSEYITSNEGAVYTVLKYLKLNF
ncbi:3-deoxy-D-manno-octulosonic acid transferase [Flavobacteriaceae bacterium XHP0103]|uniref:3-deoxy-D-manno-octulosonic acid transferase n=1 Tax=Marixanthotalea marina TaxID=2844359 RepID=UPI002989F839|nr:glycosyltransferase N-terminal domain-containing protein [Marixanthotalea marina]MBU3821952.1 3-deoxy-D-manno-octulosonic acid transferase [Marixanthotalea marina]